MQKLFQNFIKIYKIIIEADAHNKTRLIFQGFNLIS